MAVERHELMDDYQEFAASDMGADAADEAWRITDDSAADWALRRIAQLRRAIEQRKQFVEREIERLRAWQAERDEPDLRTIAFFEGHLRMYFDRLRTEGALGKRKSYKLPHGTLAVRASGPKYERDNEMLLRWAQETGDETLVRITATPAWTEIKKRITVGPDGRSVIDTVTGEVIPGIEVAEPAGETFSVTTEEVD